LSKSRLVEEAFCLSIAELVRNGVFSPDAKQFIPFHAVGSPPYVQLLKCSCRPHVADGQIRALDVVVQIGSHSGWTPFEIYALQVDHDSRRVAGKGWAFRCTGPDADGNPCGRPYRTLHMLPEGGGFRCRRCLGLKYLSCRRADKRLRKLVQDPSRLGVEVSMALAMLQTGALPSTTGRLAIRAAALLARSNPEGGPFGWVPPPQRLSREEISMAEAFNAGRPGALITEEEAKQFLERLDAGQSPPEEARCQVEPE